MSQIGKKREIKNKKTHEDNGTATDRQHNVALPDFNYAHIACIIQKVINKFPNRYLITTNLSTLQTMKKTGKHTNWMQNQAKRLKTRQKDAKQGRKT